jgi:hypothetical protein
MLLNRMNHRWLRPLLAIFTLAGITVLAGCGGGSGAPNNPFAPGPPVIGPLFVLPSAATVYAHTPATLTVSGGSPPYQAFSSNSAILPVAQAVGSATIVLVAADVAADTVVTITVQDSIGQTAISTVTVSPAPLLNTLTIVPARTICGANTVCSGDTATATVTVAGPTGAGIPNRQVRFDVVTGAFAIQTNNPASPLASSVTVVSDANGNARVVVQATVNAPTQPAQIRATDLTTGNSVTALFTIVQQTDGSAILSVVPNTATITGVGTCSAGFRIDYFIYGGTPPYHVSSSFPDAVTLVNTTVFAPGSAFEAITNGSCVNPLTFTIVDAIGRQTTATLINEPGTAVPPVAASALVFTLVNPVTPTPGCTAGTVFSFSVQGGTPPYNFSTTTNSPSAPLYNPTSQQLNGPGGFHINGLTPINGSTGSTTFVTVTDSTLPVSARQSKVLSVTCNP